MQKIMVKCFYCGEQFDRLSVKNTKIGRRYAHQECFDKYYSDEEEYRLKIHHLAKNLFSTDYNYQAVEAQRKRFLKDGMTNRGIYLTLEYYFEVKKNNLAAAKGRIGIVPFVYEEAKKYYEDIDRMANNLERAANKPVAEKLVDVSAIASERKKPQKIELNFD